MLHLNPEETEILERACRHESVSLSSAETKKLLRTINDLRFVQIRIAEETIYGEKDSFDAMKGIIEERDELRSRVDELKAQLDQLKHP